MVPCRLCHNMGARPRPGVAGAFCDKCWKQLRQPLVGRR